MPTNQFQRMVFAFITVFITVHAYVFYSFYVVNGCTLMDLNDASSVITAINNQGGIYMFGKYLPVWTAISFIASFLYYPYYEGFNIITLLANWLKLVNTQKERKHKV